MKKYSIITHSLLVLTVAIGLTGSIVAPLRNNAQADETNNDTVKEIAIGTPVRIMIPSITLDAVIEKVALKKDGSMDVPKDPMNAGWYQHGPLPGAVGSSVIDGHLNWLHGATGVFAKLDTIKIGDRITVEDENGTPITFIVREIRTYNAGADTAEIFSSNDGKAHLNLITCDGAWDKKLKRYTNRLVVFSERVE